MNDPSKRINVNISSLLSLKAELLRKQEEVNKAKTTQTIESHQAKKSGKFDNKKQEETKNDANNGKNQGYEEYEDSELFAKSRRVLEAKAKYYEKMVSAGGSLNSDDRCLVQFNRKKQNETPPRRVSTDSSRGSSEAENDFNDTPKNPDEEWVEYTDCLGRTRQCLRKDLEFFKKKDSKLAENIQPRQFELNQNAPMWMIDTKGTTEPSTVAADDAMTEVTSIVSKHDQMKVNWEKKEEENAYKENVHYQDVLFDEARTHGVGYYAFSTDDEERAKQRAALDEAREATLNLQKEREAQRLQREKIIAERVRAAKNRTRARMGLPPLEDEPEPQPDPVETKEEAKLKKKEEKAKRKKEKEEKKREEQRKNHLRPWDRPKVGRASDDDSSSSNHSDSEEEWNYKPEKEPMSQEQWNEMKRAERVPEFAPVPPDSNPKHLNRNPFATPSVPPPVICPEAFPMNHSLYFTTKKPESRPESRPEKRPEKRFDKHKEFVKRNSTQFVSDVNTNETLLNDRPSRGGVEIAPPPTFEYYGPSSTKRSKAMPKPNLESSIEAGLRFLRERSDKGNLQTKSSWTAKADYDA